MSGSAAILLAALLLDAALGEPGWLWSRLPHPAVLMGRAIGWADRRFNRGPRRKATGVAVLAALVLAAGCLGAALAALSPFGLLETLVVAILLAQRSLADHVAEVGAALRRSLEDGRAAVGRIVGRDTGAMDEAAVARAAIESAAENLSDGVIAPAFWYLLAGLPGLLVYKLVNTADSMIGYRSDRYRDFGWAAARLDDLLNWLPARLTAALITVSQGRFGVWGAIRREARQHRSPNAGWPEAAMAHGIGVALSGPRSYGGERRDFPFINPDGNRSPGPAEIAAAVSALWRGWGLMLLIVALLVPI